jgi:outer membrane lipoprotein-sorting protein
LSAQSVSRLSVHRESQALINGSKVTEQADCYYFSDNQKMVIHSHEPKEYINIISNKGEIKIYFPKSNELMMQQSSYLSSTKEDLYIYVNNMYDDLGLRVEGFSMIDTKYEGEMMIVNWAPPASHKDKIQKIKIVYENMMPIYSATYNFRGELYKKTYYSNYLINNNIILPQRVTDITYTSKTDSIIRRILYSDIKINDEVDDYYKNYKIPENAKLIK